MIQNIHYFYHIIKDWVTYETKGTNSHNEYTCKGKKFTCLDSEKRTVLKQRFMFSFDFSLPKYIFQSVCKINYTFFRVFFCVLLQYMHSSLEDRCSSIAVSGNTCQWMTKQRLLCWRLQSIPISSNRAGLASSSMILNFSMQRFKHVFLKTVDLILPSSRLISASWSECILVVASACSYCRPPC